VLQIVVVTEDGGGYIVATADTLRTAERWIDVHVERMAKVGTPAHVALWDTESMDFVAKGERRVEV
jgi:hypothetical protein